MIPRNSLSDSVHPAIYPTWRHQRCLNGALDYDQRLQNCICTPHIGYVEQESYESYFGQAFDNVVNFIRGNPTNIVNPDALQVRR